MWPDSVFACTALSSHTVQQENAQVNFNVLIFDENGPDGLLWKIRFRTAFLQDSLSRTERHASVDRCTSLGLRVDEKTALNEFQSLLHAVETKPSALPCRFEVKAHAGITDREMNRIQRFFQLPTHLPPAALLPCIVQGCLLHSHNRH